MKSFEFRVTGQFRDPLSQRLTEMVRIIMALYEGRIGGKGGKRMVKILECMNSKEEGFAPFERKVGQLSWKRSASGNERNTKNRGGG